MDMYIPHVYIYIIYHGIRPELGAYDLIMLCGLTDVYLVMRCGSTDVDMVMRIDYVVTALVLR